jgi:hypothetical protein
MCFGSEYALSAVTWLLLTAAFIVELDRFVPHRTWLLRFPLLFIFAGEIAKFRWRGCPAPSFSLPVSLQMPDTLDGC